MANSNKAPAAEAAEHRPGETMTIEELAHVHQVPDWVMAGLIVANGWGQGKELTEIEFLKAKDAWLAGPMKGGK
jgi:hypothetical protein